MSETEEGCGSLKGEVHTVTQWYFNKAASRSQSVRPGVKDVCLSQPTGVKVFIISSNVTF